MTRRQSSTSSSSAGARTIAPALQAAMSSRSSSVTTAATAHSHASASPRSAWTTEARRPCWRTSAAVSAASERWTSPTSAPSIASRTAIARPIPRLAPVTSATLPTSGSGLPLDVSSAAVRPEDEVALAIRHMVEGDRRERFEERHARRREEAVTAPAVDHHDVTCPDVPLLVLRLDGHLAVDDRHDLLGVLMRVLRNLLAGVVGHSAEQHLLAADRVEVDAIDEQPRLLIVPRAERGRLR